MLKLGSAPPWPCGNPQPTTSHPNNSEAHWGEMGLLPFSHTTEQSGHSAQAATDSTGLQLLSHCPSLQLTQWFHACPAWSPWFHPCPMQQGPSIPQNTHSSLRCSCPIPHVPACSCQCPHKTHSEHPMFKGLLKQAIAYKQLHWQMLKLYHWVPTVSYPTAPPLSYWWVTTFQ